ncbi:MAG: bifunctional (p)ppGpp synthetase/guanosine-3',5'-bis(diphosphate) 3'-pyrophosphohydrolase [Bdellovibrionales bacterium]|nr:bifunctional (p)ppGpp synthetase/guanosine-3',5'-bis(diphosphate) 3'-pyrophosphohydrolase [Bdellovibrionales bacterium]
MALPRLFDEGINETSPETIEELIERVLAYNPNADISILQKAYDLANGAHEGQLRRSGEPYIIHPLGVAGILADLRLDVASLATGILHDVVEDTKVSLDEIEKQFGVVIRELVDGVTKLSQMQFRQTHEKQGENIRKMIVAMGKDVRVVLVKLSDRLHNMRTLKHLPFDKQKRIAEETLDIYAPLAGRLGISSLKIELEDLSFRYSNPEQYYDLAQKIQKKKKERDKFIEDVRELIAREIKSRSTVQTDISGRSKHLYSIYKKMHNRNVDYDQIYDLLAFRITVGNIAECYEVLGIIHSIFKPIPGRFKDFIAMPKTNNYQSLHTTVIGPGGERIEIQIRTREMHLIAEWGIAAHWKYKEESRGTSKDIDGEAVNKFNWLKDLVSQHQGTNSSDEFLENIKGDLFESEIYVFTPKGEVKELPEGSTPIDFAFSVHTDVGSRIVAARINGKIVTLKHKLRNGDTVEVITSKTQTPSKDWLKICVTSRAKSKIRAFVKTEQRKRALDLGKELLERSFRKESIPLQKYFSGPKFEKLLKDEGCMSLDDLYIRVGYGKITPQKVIEEIVPDKIQKPEEEDLTKESFLSKAFKSAVSRSKKSASVITVDGMNDVLVRYAKCCVPIPGDSILGFISRGRGITIHRADCEKAYELDQARAIDVAWSKSPIEASSERQVRLKVMSQDKSGLLKSMSEVFATRGVNIINVQARTSRDLRAVSIFDVSVRDTKQLSEVIADLKKLPGVLEVERTSFAQD